MWFTPIRQTTEPGLCSLRPHDAVALLDAVATLDSKAFPQAVNHLLAPAMPVAHSAVFLFRAGRTPVLDCEASVSDNAALPREAGIVYMDGHYRSDELARFIDGLGRRRLDDLLAFRQSLEDIADPHYRRNCYQRCRVIDRLSLVIPVPSDRSAASTWLSLNLYRTIGSNPFTKQELSNAQGMLAVVASALKLRHFARSNNTVPRLGHEAGPSRLSHREAQVADLLVRGLSSREIAKQLGIQPSTVTTLRRRAYEKLNVRNGKALAARWAAG